MSVQVDVETQNYDSNSLIYEKGDTAEFVYLIQEGSAVAEVGQEKIELHKGDMFGDVGAVSGEYPATLRAGDAGCQLLVIPLAKLKDEIGRSPPLIQLLIGNMMGRMKIAAQLVEELSSRR